MDSIYGKLLYTVTRNEEGIENKYNPYLQKCLLAYLLYHNDCSSIQN